jgi:excisionase family DNA binding protein
MNAHPVLNDQVYCPRCGKYAQLLRIQKAARLVDVTSRTVYRYIEEGCVGSFKIGGKTYRVCAACLLNQKDSEQ